ncbi:hypothetical protein [Oryzisolibacter propanilivorax]|uniref:hypothetical protein n=1 Tax=Oryzisolibacter propanilivorax TaxID=1527607 RepID=UPI001586FA66|nr:hypothetical protein [Oryzisolibacter propanilivorax]
MAPALMGYPLVATFFVALREQHTCAVKAAQHRPTTPPGAWGYGGAIPSFNP